MALPSIPLIPPRDLPELFGEIDISLFDQLLKGRLTPGMRLLGWLP